MTETQRAVILIFCAILVVMLLFPPYIGHGMDVGYFFFYNAVGKMIEKTKAPVAVRINTSLLLAQYLYVVTIGAGLWLFLKPRDKGGPK